MRVMLLAESPGYRMFERTLYKSTVFAFPKAQLLGCGAIRILGADESLTTTPFPQGEEAKENDMNRNIVDTVFKAVALGMGVAVIVLNTLGSLSADTAVTLLGIGVTALAIVELQK